MVELVEPATLERDRVVAWALGTFHAASLVILLVLPLYLSGGLTSVLTSLSTASGLALFGALWLTTVWSTHHAPHGALGTGLKLSVPLREVIIRAVLRGGLNGLAFLAFLAVILGISAVLNGQLASVITLVVVGGLVFAFGAVIAYLVGGLLGGLFACIDIGLISLSRWILD